MSLRKVNIQGTIYQAIQVPDTQEDNAGGVIGRWKLYNTDDIECETPIGRIAQWSMNMGYVVVLGTTRNEYPGEPNFVEDVPIVQKTYTEKEVNVLLLELAKRLIDSYNDYAYNPITVSNFAKEEVERFLESQIK